MHVREAREEKITIIKMGEDEVLEKTFCCESRQTWLDLKEVAKVEGAGPGLGLDVGNKRCGRVKDNHQVMGLRQRAGRVWEGRTSIQ